MNTRPFEQGFKLLKNSYRFAVASLLSAAFMITSTMSVSASPQVTFNGTGVGPIPDGPSTSCQTPGNPLNIQFAVTGLTANVQSVNVSITMQHTWAGDVVATLIPPAGGNGLTLFSYIGYSANPSGGDSSNLNGTYIFTDSAAADQVLWKAAVAAPTTNDTIAPGSYRPAPTGDPATGSSLNTTFGGLTPAQANGNWTLRLTDGCQDDFGSVSAAVLDISTGTVTPPVAAKPFFDYFGSGKSSFAVYNAPEGGNVLWRVLNNGGTGQETIFWGLTDFDYYTPGYFDADNRADIAVFRPSNTAGQSFFYIRNTNPVALNAIPYGTAADFGGYDADYDGDGRDDPTVIRRTSGGQWLWSYRASTTNTLRSIPFGTAATTQAGTATEDIPMAGGDFSGDGRADFALIRRNDAGAETIIWGDSVSGQLLGSFIWGEYNTDYYVLGDFLGDSRMDFAVWRGAGSTTDGTWYIRENGGTGYVARQFGVPRVSGAGDLAIAGDFGGDGKYDIAVYRQSNNTFYWLNSPTATTVSGQQFGTTGDRPVGEFRTY